MNTQFTSSEIYIIVVYFVYGLAFFSLGLALVTTCRRRSIPFRFLSAIVPLAAFGLLHATHEWIEMLQAIAVAGDETYTPTLTLEIIRVSLLAASFLCLLAFGMYLVSPEPTRWRRLLLSLAGMTLLWLAATFVTTLILDTEPLETIAMADVLSRYILAIPAAGVGAWALMWQQRIFREHDMPQFGRYLVWAATALLLYGVIGQLFVRETGLFPSTLLNSGQFMQWFGFPVQLFRGIIALILAYFLIRALDAFEFESRRRLGEANKTIVETQQAQIELERRNRVEMERLNDELRETAHELALLLDLTNLLVSPISLDDRLHQLLDKLVRELKFCDSAMITLAEPTWEKLTVAASMGFRFAEDEQPCAMYEEAIELSNQCVQTAIALCRHTDDLIIEFNPETALDERECQSHDNPMTILALPLMVEDRVIGSLVFGRQNLIFLAEMSLAEFKLILGVAQGLGLSLEYARLVDEAEDRKNVLAELLHQAVGTQEAERQRIARELHDATGQSLTAISLGLRGVETVLTQESNAIVKEVHDLGGMSTQALGELRQIIADLRPTHLDDLGLAPAVRWYLKDYESRRSIQTVLSIHGEQMRLPPEYETVLFRIMQEAMTNVTKHAEATEVLVTLEMAPSQVTLSVKDNGKGFDIGSVLERKQTYEGWGLLGMHERATLLGGQVAIQAAAETGTCVEVTVPLQMES
ncbi:MAG: hypothetical protein GY759_01085 [Chloroflexi bacterium]|nr:hypothetical protein [Chloroflexota bacterium]